MRLLSCSKAEGEWSGLIFVMFLLSRRKLTLSASDIASALKKNLEGFEPSLEARTVGRVAEVGDGIARVSGLPDCAVNELLEFEDGTVGLAMNLDEPLRDAKQKTLDVLDVPFKIRPNVTIPVGAYSMDEWIFTVNSSPGKRIYERFMVSPVDFYGGTRLNMTAAAGIRAVKFPGGNLEQFIRPLLWRARQFRRR